ncbi:MAG TPA: type II toxin-antitoxin system RelE/ParE family toxin [Thermoanaerobaculia bacterium]|nr:type II toxin-antitoxin system RelE/ParE family toxin [Thermoanaerobaculia bacterium]
MTAKPWSVRLLREAVEDFAALDAAVTERVERKLRWLAERADEVVDARLHGDLAGLSKLRVGPWRVLYERVTEERLLLVYAVGHRREIYDLASGRR